MSKLAIFGAGILVGLTFTLASPVLSQVFAHVNTNGMLKGYVVQKNGQTVCEDPMVWNQFRGPTSYIVCE